MDIGKDLQRAYDDGYAKAIDDFATRLKQHLYPMSHGLVDYDIDKIADQLKEGGKHESKV